MGWLLTLTLTTLPILYVKTLIIDPNFTEFSYNLKGLLILTGIYLSEEHGKSLGTIKHFRGINSKRKIQSSLPTSFRGAKR